MIAATALVVLAGVHAALATAIAGIVLVAALVAFAHEAFELADRERRQG